MKQRKSWIDSTAGPFFLLLCSLTLSKTLVAQKKDALIIPALSKTVAPFEKIILFASRRELFL
jgi:hypothetical protein